MCEAESGCEERRVLLANTILHKGQVGTCYEYICISRQLKQQHKRQ